MTALLLRSLLLLVVAAIGHYGASSHNIWWIVALAMVVGIYLISGGLQLVAIRSFFHWIKKQPEQPAPALSGLWGEVAYQVERTLRLRDHKISSAQDQLRRFLLAIQASPNGILLLDASDRIDWCNATAAEHFGLNPQTDLHQTIGNLVRDPEFIRSLHNQRQNSPVTMARKDSRGRLSVQSFSYGEGYRMLLSTDITTIERADRMRRDFVANVSHEIRTPLTVLSGFIETMQTLPLSADETKRYLGLMGQQARRLQTLVNDLLMLAKLEGSPRPALSDWIDVQALIKPLQHEAGALSGSAHLIDFDAQPCEVAGVERELYSAMSNLVTNAIRYTPSGGRIDVRWDKLDDGRCEFSVTDTGMGIAPEHLARLTERFYRVDSSRSRDTGGTGLGLSIVKHVVMRHGGELHIDSLEGKGSRFSFTLPSARTRATAEA